MFDMKNDISNPFIPTCSSLYSFVFIIFYFILNVVFRIPHIYWITVIFCFTQWFSFLFTSFFYWKFYKTLTRTAQRELIRVKIILDVEMVKQRSSNILYCIFWKLYLAAKLWIIKFFLQCFDFSTETFHYLLLRASNQIRAPTASS